MANLFFKAVGFTSNRELPVLKNVSDILSLFEMDSLDHWIFGNDASTLIGRANSRVAKRQSTATKPLTWTTNSVGIPQKNGEAIELPYTDTVDRHVAFAGLFNVNSSQGINILQGTLGSAGATPNGGSSLFVSAGKAYLTVREGSNNLDSKLLGDVDMSKPFFIAYSHDKVTLRVETTLIQGNQTLTAVHTTGAYNPTNLPFYLGNGRYNSVMAGDNTCFEAILWDAPKTNEDFVGVAARMKDRGLIF